MAAAPRSGAKRQLVTLTIDGREVRGVRERDHPRRRSARGHLHPDAAPRPAPSRRSAPAASAWSASLGARGPVAACTTPVREGMVVDTKDRDRAARRQGRRRARALRLPEATALAQAGRARPQRAPRGRARTSASTQSRYAGERHALREGRPAPVHQDGSRTSASSADAACARATRSRAPSRSPTPGRGWDTKHRRRHGLGASPTAPCVSCGACVSTCPTGALDEAAFRAKETDRLGR